MQADQHKYNSSIHKYVYIQVIYQTCSKPATKKQRKKEEKSSFTSGAVWPVEISLLDSPKQMWVEGALVLQQSQIPGQNHQKPKSWITVIKQNSCVMRTFNSTTENRSNGKIFYNIILIRTKARKMVAYRVIFIIKQD